MSTENQSAHLSLNFDELHQALEAQPIRPGQLIEATITQIGDDDVELEFESGSGRVPRAELAQDVKIGAKATYFVSDFVDGAFLFSKTKADRLSIWAWLESMVESGLPTRVQIVGETRGGLAVSLHGMKAVLDTRDLAVGMPRTFDELKGQEIDVRIVRLVEKKTQIFVSQRALTEGDPAERRQATLDSLVEGAVVEGEVRRFAKFGAFVDIGGIDGLLHVKDIAWRRLGHPSEGVRIGDWIQVKVLSFDPETEKIALGLKQMQPDPWTDAAERYPVGQQITGEVVGLTEFGAFVMMADGIEGLVHVSEMSWTEKVTKPGAVVKKNTEVNAWVLRCETDRRRLGLTLRDPAQNPWKQLSERLQPGDKVTAKVSRVVDFGVFIDLGDGLDGLVHISDFSWAVINESPADLYTVGQEIEAMLLDVDVERGRANLGIKHLSEDLTSELIRKYAVGDALTAKVTSIQSYGVFAELEPGLEGLIHISALGLSDDQSPDDVADVGQQIDVKILAVDEIDRRLSLAMIASGASDDASKNQASSPDADGVESPSNDDAEAADQAIASAVDEPQTVPSTPTDGEESLSASIQDADSVSTDEFVAETQAELGNEEAEQPPEPMNETHASTENSVSDTSDTSAVSAAIDGEQIASDSVDSVETGEQEAHVGTNPALDPMDEKPTDGT